MLNGSERRNGEHHGSATSLAEAADWRDGHAFCTKPQPTKTSQDQHL